MKNSLKSFVNSGISKVFFYFLVFFLPLGVKKIFFTEISYFHGFYIFYNAFYLYLTDLLFLCLMLCWVWEKRNYFHSLFTEISQDKIYRTFSLFLLILAISIIVSREKWLSAYGLMRFLEYFLIFAYIRENIRFSREISQTFWLILGSLWFQSVVGIGQYLKQHWLGLWIFGEEHIIAGVQGIAEFISHGLVSPYLSQIFPILRSISAKTYNMRAYGTFPHANILSVFCTVGLFVNIFLIYTLSSQQKSNFSRPPCCEAGEKYWVKFLILSFSLILIFTGLIVAFSRVGYVFAAFGAAAWLMIIFLVVRRPHMQDIRTGQARPETTQYFPAKVALVVVLLIVAFGVNVFAFGPQIKDRLLPSGGIETLEEDQSVVYRATFNSIAWNMIKTHPVFGVGERNFVAAMDDFSPEKLLPDQHQPVHNAYLLIAAESGVVALLVFLLLIYYIVRHAVSIAKVYPVRQFTLVVIIFGLLVWGLFDHFIVTLPQSAILFWIILGLASTKKPRQYLPQQQQPTN